MKRSFRIIAAALAAVMIAAAIPAFAAGFSDVESDRWSAPDITYAVEKGYMNGTGNVRFSPEDTMTRAMVVTVLWRRDGSPSAKYQPVFADVAKDAYYAAAVMWSKSEGIVNGTSASEFSPDAKVTREQLAAMLKRYTESHRFLTSAKTDLGAFSDAGTVSEYAVDSMSWAVGAGLISGTTKTTLSPGGSATREQFAAILHRYDGVKFSYSKAIAKLNPVYPEEGDVIDVTSALAKRFILRFGWGDFDDPEHPERVYDWLPDEDSAFLNKENGRGTSDPCPITFRWTCNDPTRLMRFQISESEDMKTAAGVTVGPIVSETDGVYSCTVTNFKTGTRYFWRVITDFRGNSPVASFSTAPSRVRQLFVEGGSNVRDLGGGVNAEGKRVRQGAIYRGAEVELADETGHCLTDRGRQILAYDLGVKTRVDLQAESVGAERHLGKWYGVGYVVTPCSEKWVPILTGEGAERMKAIFDVVLDTDRYPIYFHCHAGADRTGTVAAMLELLLGIDMEDIRLDYDLTSLALWDLRSWYDGNEGDREAFFAELAAMFPDAATPQEQAEAFALSIGVTREKIDAFREYMLLD